MSCLCILKISPLLVVSFANIFSHSVSCLFILFMDPFAVQKLLIWAPLFIFVFISITLGDESQKILLQLCGFHRVDHNKLWKILQEMGIQDHLTCLLRNLYAGQEATVRTRRETTDWFQIGKGVHQGCILSPCVFNSYAEYITQNARLDEAQAGIKTAGRNINNLRYANDIILMEESEEELKSLLMKVKDESKKAGLKLNIQKMKIMASGLITS